MCLELNKDSKITIAQSPIVVKKIVLEDTDTTWTAPYMKSKHEYNKELSIITSELVIHEPGTLTGKHINIGFHAYTQNKDLSNILTGGFIEKVAVIPKGAEYCIGYNDNIVASKIIVFSSKDQFENYINKVD